MYTEQLRALAKIVAHSTAEELFKLRASISTTLNEASVKIDVLAGLQGIPQKPHPTLKQDDFVYPDEMLIPYP